MNSMETALMITMTTSILSVLVMGFHMRKVAKRAEWYRLERNRLIEHVGDVAERNYLLGALSGFEDVAERNYLLGALNGFEYTLAHLEGDLLGTAFRESEELYDAGRPAHQAKIHHNFYEPAVEIIRELRREGIYRGRRNHANDTGDAKQG